MLETITGIVAAIAILAQPALESRAAYRYRVAIANLLQLKPGMAVAEVGPGAGFLSSVMTPKLEPGGKAVALESAAGLQPASVDAVALINAFAPGVKADDLVRAAGAAVKPGGALLVVDIAREGIGAAQQGIDADDLVSLATTAGFKREAESGIVPGHFAIRFRKP